jgi:hypothetical protein
MLVIHIVIHQLTIGFAYQTTMGKVTLDIIK